MTDIQLGLWGNDRRAGSKPRQMRRYLIYDYVLGNIWQVSAKNEMNAHVICNLNPEMTDIVCIGLKPVLSSAVNHGLYTSLWTAHKRSQE